MNTQTLSKKSRQDSIYCSNWTYRASFLAFIGIVFLGLSGCASHKKSSHTEYILPRSQIKQGKADTKSYKPSSNYAKLKNVPQKVFAKPLDLDQVLRPEEIALADSSFSSSDSLSGKEEDKPFRIQILSIADFEKAQTQKYQLSQTLGKPVDVLFEPPFYKLQFGHFSTRKEANYQLSEIKRLGVRGFVVKKQKQ